IDSWSALSEPAGRRGCPSVAWRLEDGGSAQEDGIRLGSLFERRPRSARRCPRQGRRRPKGGSLPPALLQPGPPQGPTRQPRFPLIAHSPAVGGVAWLPEFLIVRVRLVRHRRYSLQRRDRDLQASPTAVIGKRCKRHLGPCLPHLHPEGSPRSLLRW